MSGYFEVISLEVNRCKDGSIEYQVKWATDGSTTYKTLQSLYCDELIIKYECTKASGGSRKVLKSHKITVDNMLLAEWLDPVVSDLVSLELEVVERLKQLAKESVYTKLET